MSYRDDSLPSVMDAARAEPQSPWLRTGARHRVVGVVSRGILRIPHLASLLGCRYRPIAPWRPGSPASVCAMAGWGRKPSALRARRLADEHGVPYLALEDGFLRSIAPGKQQGTVSMVIDDVGIYYDAGSPSRLEILIGQAEPDEDLLAQTRRGIGLILRHRLSKYNHAPVVLLPQRRGAARVLVVDQTSGDMSVVLGGAGGPTFAAMLNAALREWPDAEIWVKTHPEVLSGGKSGYLDIGRELPRVHWLAEDCCPLSLIEQVDRVYVVTSQMGFEALMLGKPVTCFGQPWYAGWGLTDDRHPERGVLRQRRACCRTLEQLFAAAYLKYTHYLDPATGAAGTLFDAIDWLARNKILNDEHRGTLYCLGMSIWKRAVVRPFLSMPSNRLKFVKRLSQEQVAGLPADASLVVWGSRHPLLRSTAFEHGVPVLRIEDGFVRSAGLGSDLNVPLSLALDGPGIYYDPRRPSRMETMLATVRLSDADRLRVTRIRERIARLGISKYNLGGAFSLPEHSISRKVLLVPGQVEGDASIQFGSPRIRKNLDLLAAVRAANPNAWIVYKPHPDVVAGNRHGAVAATELAALADQIVARANISACIRAADEIHTMTSLTGFEALLQGRKVHCYGAPFYAGWGLTVDHVPLPHRQRRLSLDELLFVTLCSYPRYRLPGAEGFCSVEDVVAHLSDSSRTPAGIGSHWIGRQFRKARELARLLF